MTARHKKSEKKGIGNVVITGPPTHSVGAALVTIAGGLCRRMELFAWSYV